MKKKSDYAIVMSCTPGYGFGMISTMNAQNYFKTDADWEIAYESYTEEQRQAISNAFPFNVNWTPVSELMEGIVDRRTDKSNPFDRMWFAYWLLAHKVLKEKKYKAVCVIQADHFVFVNLDSYFRVAAAGFLICGEYSFNFLKVEELPLGDDRAIWDRMMCPIFDAINFLGQDYTQLPMDIVNFQCEDSFKGESSHSVVALNRAVCRYGKKGMILGLEGKLWVSDSIWAQTKLYVVGDKVYNDRQIPLKGWHCRWWQNGMTQAQWRNNKESLIKNKDNKEVMESFDNQEHNFNVVKTFMERFNNMIPEIKSEEYLKGVIRRSRYELGEL